MSHIIPMCGIDCSATQDIIPMPRVVSLQTDENSYECDYVIIATGGGAVLREQNVMLLGGNGKIYFVDRPLELLVTTDDRPLSSNRDDLVKRYEERYETYCRVADKKIINDGEIETVVNSIKEDFLT